MRIKENEARTVISRVRAKLDSVKGFCPQELLLECGQTVAHPPFECQGVICKTCARANHHDTRHCTEERRVIKETCDKCHLPQTLCQERLHDPQTEYGTDACPWWPLTLAVVVKWRKGELDGALYGLTRAMNFKDVMQKLWLVPHGGDLLPPGLRIIDDALQRLG